MACCCASNDDHQNSTDSASDTDEEIEVPNIFCVPKAVKASDEEELIIKPVNDTMRDEATGDVFEYGSRYLVEGSDRIAIHDVFSDDAYTYKEANEMINTIAQNLYQHFGFKPGDQFAIYSLNQIDFVFLLFAIWKLRGIYVGINPQLKQDEVRRELLLTECKFLYAHPMVASYAVLAIAGTQVKTIFIDVESEEFDCTKYGTLTKELSETVVLPSFPADPDDVCAVMFSSGTTGLPKAVEITHRNLVSCGTLPMHITDCAHRVAYMPMAHIGGCMVLLTNFHHHKTMHLMSHFDLHVFLKYISEYRINAIGLVPPLAVLLVKTEVDPSLDLTCVETVYCGTAPLHQEVVTALKKKLGGNVYIRQVYGLTETGVLAVCTPCKDSPWGGDKCPAGSVGLPSIGYEVKICSLTTEKTLGHGNMGEVCLRGDLLMKGYLKDPEATRQAIDKDGWFHSGDYGYVDENGYIFVVDRIVDLIKYKGKKIPPTELETLLLSHEAIADAGVISIPDEECGAVPHAWVVLHPEMTLTETELRKWMAERVPSYKQLRGGIKFVPFIPKSPVGKVLHREMKKITLGGKKT